MKMVLWVFATAAVLAQVTPASRWPWARPASFSDLAYPAEALAVGQAGVVVVRVTTDDKGSVESAAALTGPDLLVRAALDNVRTWSLSPSVRDGAIAYRFEIDSGICQDDGRSLFRLVRPNFAVVTACSAPGRPVPTWPSPELDFVTRGAPPRYPHIALNARITGVVVLELLVDGQGHIDPRPLTDVPFFTEVAVAHARQWRVQPTATKRYVEVYEFALDNRDCQSETNTVFWTISSGHVRLSGCSPRVSHG